MYPTCQNARNAEKSLEKNGGRNESELLNGTCVTFEKIKFEPDWVTNYLSCMHRQKKKPKPKKKITSLESYINATNTFDPPP